ncbi:hypothetical protein HPP92_012444, partial [Vanilla planifolia]
MPIQNNVLDRAAAWFACAACVYRSNTLCRIQSSVLVPDSSVAAGRCISETEGIHRKIMSYSVAEIKHSNPNSNINAAFSYDTSSNASTRRRTIVMVDKTSKDGLLTRRGENGAPIDKLIYSGKELSHTIRGETLLERPRDAHLRKGLIAASIPSKRRKSINRQLKPTWQIVFRSIMKNVLLLAALLFFGLVIWRWTTEAGRGVNPSFSTFNFDVRISEVELSLKEATKQFQVQMEFVDKKIGSEISLLEREVKKQVEERGAFIWNELKNLKDKTDDLAMSFTRLEDMNLLSKEKFGKLWNELEIRQSIDLDQIRKLAREIVQKEIEKHAADGLGMLDYALASGGARVRKHSAPYAVRKPSSWLAAAKFKSNIHSKAHKMLEPSFGEPGQCFAFLGSSGFVEVRLRTEIIPEAVTLEHVSK